MKNLLFYRPNTSLNLLCILLLFSGLPSVIKFSHISEFFNFVQINLLYGLFSLLRESIILLLGIQLISYLFIQIKRERISYLTLIFLIPIPSFIYLILNDFNLILFIIGIRFFILISLPLLVIKKFNQLRKYDKTKILDIIFILYFLLNFSFYLFNYNIASDGHGYNFLGPRLTFIYNHPVVAAMTLGAINLYFNFRIFTSKNKNTRLFFLTNSLITFFLTLLTGGRAGIAASLLIIIFSTIRSFLPDFKKYLLIPKSKINNFIILGIIGIFTASTIFAVSLESISGRPIFDEISNKNFLVGFYGTRGEILSRALNPDNSLRLIFGSPGVGTNTAKLFNICEECIISDSSLTAFLLSFGLLGWLLIITHLKILLTNSYSFLIPITYFIFSLTDNLPEYLFPWITIVLLLSLSPKITSKK